MPTPSSGWWKLMAPSTSYSADNLPPGGHQNPRTPLGGEMAEMLRVIEHARETAIGLQANTPFDLWLDLYEAQSAWGDSENLAPLLSGFGTSMVERALIEAACRAANKPFAAAVRDQDLGIAMAAVQIQLSTTKPHEWLPEQPLQSIIARHTVGLADPLTPADIPADEAVADQLPKRSPTASPATNCAISKSRSTVNPTPIKSAETLAEIITQHAPTDFAFMLDGNE